ncbi:MAG TPA: pseudouridine synthase [Gammaproteobacteria bacterium]|nr:pseudouridine synthase [Gammaproteobacteria bacterium]
MLVLFNKPYGVLCQFTGEDRATLADYIKVKSVYPAGRLDTDSEGLLMLTDDGRLQNRISHPHHKLPKTYFAQVEGVPTVESLQRLARGVELNDGITLPARAQVVPAPDWLWPRDPPIRFRKRVADSWIELTLTEGRNRQVRRMTAAVGHPTLRLVRWAVGEWTVGDMKPGEYRCL